MVYASTVDLSASKAHAEKVKSEYLGKGTTREWDNHIREYFAKFHDDISGNKRPSVQSLIKNAHKILYHEDGTPRQLRGDKERMDLWKSLNEAWLLTSQTIDPGTAKVMIAMTRNATDEKTAMKIWKEQLGLHAQRIETSGMRRNFVNPTVEGANYYDHHVGEVCNMHSNSDHGNDSASWHLVYDVLYLSWIGQGRATEEGPPPLVPPAVAQLGQQADAPLDTQSQPNWVPGSRQHSSSNTVTDQPSYAYQNAPAQSQSSAPASNRQYAAPMTQRQAQEKKILEKGGLNEMKLLAVSSTDANSLDSVAHYALGDSALANLARRGVLRAVLRNENTSSETLDFIARKSRVRGIRAMIPPHEHVNQATLTFLAMDSSKKVKIAVAKSTKTPMNERAKLAVADNLKVMAEAVKWIDSPDALDLAAKDAAKGTLLRALNTDTIIGPRQFDVFCNIIDNENVSNSTLDWLEKNVPLVVSRVHDKIKYRESMHLYP